ncbi:MAG: hypothetical protein KF777_12580 [Planctomycetaceae bacterium]|nr:hypothetical protein [Planctomycetaceae bacterium]
MACPISASDSIQGDGQLRQLARTKAAASPAPRYVGCSTTRDSITSCAFNACNRTRVREPLNPK